MPILGLFPTAGENRYRRKIDRMARGEGPSVARTQMLEGLRRTQAGMLGAASAQRGTGAGLANRNAMLAGAEASANVNAEAARQKQQEMLWALGEQNRLEQERVAGINNAFMGAARLGAAAATGGMSEATGLGGAASGAIGGAKGAASSGGGGLMNAPMGQVYGYLDQEFGPPGSVGNATILSDESVKRAAAAGNERARRMLDDYARLVRSRRFQRDLERYSTQYPDQADTPADLPVPEEPSSQDESPRFVGDLDMENPVDRLIQNSRNGRIRNDLLNNIGTAVYKNPDTAEMLRNAPPREFEYRNPRQPGASPGRRLGVMAQDLRRSELGRQITRERPDGRLGIDVEGAVSALLAAQADQQQRLDALTGEAPRQYDDLSGIDDPTADPLDNLRLDQPPPPAPATAPRPRRAGGFDPTRNEWDRRLVRVLRRAFRERGMPLGPWGRWNLNGS